LILRQTLKSIESRPQPNGHPARQEVGRAEEEGLGLSTEKSKEEFSAKEPYILRGLNKKCIKWFPKHKMHFETVSRGAQIRIRARLDKNKTTQG